MSTMKGTVLVVGFNIRPVACLCKRLGFRVIAVDYWGDVDIKGCTDSLFAVLQQKRGEQLGSNFDKPCSELLVELAENPASQLKNIDFILIGSGLDDRPDLWARLQRIAPILGNSPEKLRVIRNPEKLFAIAKKEGISFPKTEKAHSSTEAVKIAENIGFPVVLKPVMGSGGFRIRFGRNPKEVKMNFDEVAGKWGEVWVQEYIKGINASSSILCNGNNCKVITVNEQLIGIKRLGVSAPFSYCGNIVPLKADNEIISRIKHVSIALAERLKLIGSNGFDFVIGPNNEPYLMEINPRFQATLECIKYVTGLNLVKEHIKACYGKLPKKIPQPKGYAVKMIVFAKKKSVIPDLRGTKHIFDIPYPGIVVDKGSPICTVQLFSQNREKAIQMAFETVSRIYKLLDKSSSDVKENSKYNF